MHESPLICPLLKINPKAPKRVTPTDEDGGHADATTKAKEDSGEVAPARFTLGETFHQ